MLCGEHFWHTTFEMSRAKFSAKTLGNSFGQLVIIWQQVARKQEKLWGLQDLLHCRSAIILMFWLNHHMDDQRRLQRIASDSTISQSNNNQPHKLSGTKSSALMLNESTRSNRISTGSTSACDWLALVIMKSLSILAVLHYHFTLSFLVEVVMDCCNYC